MEKYGFIYLWYDRKRKMYYIGSHWGFVDDGYICSSNRMRDAYRRRPNDFRRRIIKSNVARGLLLDEEHKWLSLIREDELGKKYYNLRKHKWGHWTTDENKRTTIGNKLKGRKASPEHIESNRRQAKERVRNKTHHWTKTEHKERTRQIQYERIKDGNHPFIGGEVSKKTNKERVENGTHNFLMSETRKIVDEKRSDTWEITFPDGETIVRKNLKAFCKENNLNQGAMNQVGLGRILHHKGFRCKKLKKGEIRGKEAK